MMNKKMGLTIKTLLLSTVIFAVAGMPSAAFGQVTAKKRLPKKQSSTQAEIKKALKNTNTKNSTRSKNSRKRKSASTSKKSVRKIASVDKAGALEQITALEARPKKTKKDYIAIAELYTKLKNYPKAIENLKSANKPQSVEVLDRLSRVHALAGDVKEEIRAIEMIRAEKKASASQLTRLGDSYAAQEKIEEAVLVYRESIQQQPKYEKAYTGLYNVFSSVNNYADARLVIIEVLEKFGDQKFWLNEFCQLEIEQKYYGNAKEVCKRAIAKDNKNPNNHVYLGLALRHTGDEDQGRKILTTAANNYKGSEVAQWNAGQMSCSTSNWEMGRNQFRQCIKVAANSGRCYLGLAKTEFELKSYDKALDSLLKACEYIKGVEVEIRRFSYELDRRKEPKVAKKYSSKSEGCSSTWFKNAKKGGGTQGYARELDLCYAQ